jgi:hypothetical protein
MSPSRRFLVAQNDCGARDLIRTRLNAGGRPSPPRRRRTA